MKTLTTTLIVGVIFSSVSYGQEMPSNYEHLKSFEARIGEWVYDGPVREDFSGIMDKGDEIVARSTVKWILDKNAVEMKLSVTIKKSGLKYTSKALIGWDAQQEQIIGGGMNSFGGHELGTVTFNKDTKTWTSEWKGRDGEGKETSNTLVATLLDKDSLQVQGLDRKGGLAQGDSPKYIYKRVKK